MDLQATAQILSDYFTIQNFLYAIFGIAPALFWLTLFLKEDKKHEEPKTMISYVFIAGAVSALFSLVLQLIFRAYLVPQYIDNNSPALLLIFAAIEEYFKFYFVYLAIHKSKYFDKPLDGMIYMITGAMGFAALENIFFIVDAPDIASVLTFRFIGAVLLHAIASGFIGFYWLRKKLIVGLIIATLLHFFFNIIVLSTEYGVIVAPIMLVFVSFFLFRDFKIAEKEGESGKTL